MIPMSLAEIRNAVSGKIIQGDPKSKITDISIDSRTINPGDMFVAIIGERFDGHSFIPEAVSKGARALIVDHSIKAYPGVGIILVEDTTRALQDLARYHRMLIKGLTVIGITGSAGKTTTKDMIASVLKEKYNVTKTRGNLNNYYGLPLTLLSLDGDEEIAVLEMGMSKLGEIELLASISKPDIGVITNVGPTHLENLKTVGNVARGKRELIEGLPTNGLAILNYDNKYVRDMKDYVEGKKVIYYGFSPEADVYAEHIKVDEKNKNISFIAHYKTEKERITLQKPGKHNVYNALAAIAVARYLRVDWGGIKNGLYNIDLSSLRWDVRDLGNEITLINDTYNANPLSMKAAIEATFDIAQERVITVLGGMLELGDMEEKAHVDLGRYVAERNVDVLITVGELGR